MDELLREKKVWVVKIVWGVLLLPWIDLLIAALSQLLLSDDLSHWAYFEDLYSLWLLSQQYGLIVLVASPYPIILLAVLLADVVFILLFVKKVSKFERLLALIIISAIPLIFIADTEIQAYRQKQFEKEQVIERKSFDQLINDNFIIEDVSVKKHDLVLGMYELKFKLKILNLQQMRDYPQLKLAVLGSMKHTLTLSPNIKYEIWENGGNWGQITLNGHTLSYSFLLYEDQLNETHTIKIDSIQRNISGQSPTLYISE